MGGGPGLPQSPGQGAVWTQGCGGAAGLGVTRGLPSLGCCGRSGLRWAVASESPTVDLAAAAAVSRSLQAWEEGAGSGPRRGGQGSRALMPRGGPASSVACGLGTVEANGTGDGAHVLSARYTRPPRVVPDL